MGGVLVGACRPAVPCSQPLEALRQALPARDSVGECRSWRQVLPARCRALLGARSGPAFTSQVQKKRARVRFSSCLFSAGPPTYTPSCHHWQPEFICPQSLFGSCSKPVYVWSSFLFSMAPPLYTHHLPQQSGGIYLSSALFFWTRTNKRRDLFVLRIFLARVRNV